MKSKIRSRRFSFPRSDCRATWNGNRENPPKNDPPELVRLVGECSSLIEREVRALESLVGEFSQFARFPTAKLSRRFAE